MKALIASLADLPVDWDKVQEAKITRLPAKEEGDPDSLHLTIIQEGDGHDLYVTINRADRAY